MLDHQGNPVEGRKNLELSLDDPDLLQYIQGWDAQNIRVAAQNSKEWFKKQLSEDALSETLYRHSAQPSKDGKYAPTLRVKVVPPDHKKPTNIYIVQTNSAGEETYRPGTVEEVTKDSQVMAIVEVGGLWFVSRGFGATFVATDLLVWPADAAEETFPFQLGTGTPAIRAATQDDDIVAPPPKRQRVGDPAEWEQGETTKRSEYAEDNFE